jgi:amino acid adenylation domain-containing protein
VVSDSVPAPASLADLVDLDRLGALGIDLDGEALTDGTTSVSWREYADRVGRLAGALRSAEVGPGDRVGVHLAKSPMSFVAVHAVIRAGAVLVPVDPLAPPSAAAAVLADAGVEVLVTDARPAVLAPLADAAGLRSVLLPTKEEAPELPAAASAVTADEIAASVPAPRPDLDPEHLAYVIYTSGSTGRPKGIVHTHRSALAYATAAADAYELTGDDRLANIAPLHFDQSTFELYAAPLVGAAVVVIPDPVLRFPASVSTLIADQRATVWYSVPYLLQQLSARGALHERDLSALRWVLFGGESFPPGQLAELMARIPSATFSNVYGPAEVNQCTFHHLTDPPVGDDPVPIGRPWPAAQVRVVDAPDGEAVDPARVVAPGQEGVLLVATPTMMAGYWNRPDATSASIIDADERWYVTGDLVRSDPSGDLVFVGRLDNQVKVRGHRIELEAVDAALGDADDVASATVVVDRVDGGDDRLVALVVLDPSAAAEPALDHIRQDLRERLPRYAVPAEVRAVPALPRTTSGKVDRRAAVSLLDT